MKKQVILMLFGVSCFNLFANSLGCNRTIPEHLRALPLVHGLDYTEYEEEITKVSQTNKSEFEKILKLHLLKYANISGSFVKFSRFPKYIYRSALLSESIDLLKELVIERDVMNLINIANINLFDSISSWEEHERLYFLTFGGDEYLSIPYFHQYLKDTTIPITKIYQIITTIIKSIANMSGNALIHCIGGEHKTEIIFEIIQKCVNHLDIENIITRYKCHTAFIRENKPGGFRQKDLDLIIHYPCELIENI